MRTRFLPTAFTIELDEYEFAQLAAAKEEAMDNWDIFSIDTGADWWAAGFHATPHQQPSKTGVVDLDQSSMTSRA